MAERHTYTARDAERDREYYAREHLFENAVAFAFKIVGLSIVAVLGPAFLAFWVWSLFDG